MSWCLLLPCLILLAATVSPSAGQSGENFSTVMDNIAKINARVRPVRQASTITNITVAVHLLAIISFDSVEQKLTSNGFLEVVWHNEYTMWNPAENGHVYSVSPDPKDVWRPRLTVLNTMKDLKPLGEDYIFMVSIFEGTTMWYPAERFETFCRVDVTYFPFDTQTCEYVLFDWGGNHANLFVKQDTIDTDFFVVNGEWELLSTRAWKESGYNDGEVEGQYLHFSMKLRRRPSLLVLTILLPVVVLALVNVFVFTIPSEAGERLAYSMTALLSFGVFMSFILDSMPSSTQTLSIMAVHMSSLLVLSAVYVLLCILSLRLFHRDSSKHPVPGLLQTVIIWLEIIVCLDPPSKTNKVTTTNVDVFHMHTDLDLALANGTDMAQGKGSKAGLKIKGKLDKWAQSRKRNHADYTNPDEMTWRRVSRTLDKLLFRFFLCLVLISNIALWTITIDNYFNAS